MTGLGHGSDFAYRPLPYTAQCLVTSTQCWPVSLHMWVLTLGSIMWVLCCSPCCFLPSLMSLWGKLKRTTFIQKRCKYPPMWHLRDSSDSMSPEITIKGNRSGSQQKRKGRDGIKIQMEGKYSPSRHWRRCSSPRKREADENRETKEQGTLVFLPDVLN